MQERSIIGSFLPFFLLSLLLLFLSQLGFVSGLVGITGKLFQPLQKIGYLAIHPANADNGSEIARLKKENSDLRQQITSLKKMEQDNNAFRDQFSTTSERPQNLLPADILGMRGFVPGVSLPDEIILDKGEADGVRVGTAVIYQNNLLGQVTAVTPTRSRVALLTHTSRIFTAKTQNTSALGSVKANGDTTFLFGNVLLTEKLEKGDLVLTKGDQDIKGIGFPPGLVIGKITSVDKQPSNLFQSAEVEMQVDIRELSKVFLLKSDS